MDLRKWLARQIGNGAEIALGLAMAAVIVFDVLIAARTDRHWPLDAALAILICATALLRRLNRGWAAVTGLTVFVLAVIAVALGAISPGPLFGGGLTGLLVLGAAMVRTLPPRLAVLIAVAGTLVIAAGETAGPDGLFQHRVVWAMVAATLWAGALAVGLYLRYLDFLHRQTVDTVRRHERVDLARELHDVVAYHVTGIVVQAQAARFTGEAEPERLLSALGRIETAGTDTLAAIRQLVGLLRDPEDLDGTPAVPEPITQLVRRFTEHGPAVDLRLPPGFTDSAWPSEPATPQPATPQPATPQPACPQPACPQPASPQPASPQIASPQIASPQIASTVYRVVQEALTNITRHAPDARSVTVAIDHGPHQISVEITDDAPPPAARHSRPGGYGLVGMAERVEALGCHVEAGPLPDAGWSVHVTLPVPLPATPVPATH